MKDVKVRNFVLLLDAVHELREEWKVNGSRIHSRRREDIDYFGRLVNLYSVLGSEAKDIADFLRTEEIEEVLKEGNHE